MANSPLSSEFFPSPRRQTTDPTERRILTTTTGLSAGWPSTTGLVPYAGSLFPDLQDWLLVAKFTGGVGIQALRIEADQVVETRTLAVEADVGNVTDVAVGPNGEIVIVEFWNQRLRIATSYR